mmetsp:Transcript_3386/g.6982  ORF Transcript_3386/g.6982 Transcript_3386/m.6982 type:complete len:103 (+) Transcript_3386:960-1268(+)
MATTLKQIENFADSSLHNFAFHTVFGFFLGLGLGSISRHRFHIGTYVGGLGGGYSLSKTIAEQRKWQPPAFKASQEQIECVEALHMLVHLMDSCPLDASSVL